MHHPTPSLRGFTRIELLVCALAGTLLIGSLLPLVAAGASRSREFASLSNLKTLGAAHAAYAADRSDRRFTHAPENLGQTPAGQIGEYMVMFGCPPSIVLGFGCSSQEWQCGVWGFWMPCSTGGGSAGNFQMLWPMWLKSGSGHGRYQLVNVVGFNEYVNGRFIDSVF